MREMASSAPVTPGEQDVARAAAELAARIPPALEPLARVAYDYRWSWLPDGDRLFAEIEPHRWELCGHNPVRLLQEASRAKLERAAGDDGLIRRAAALATAIREDLVRPAAPAGDLTPERPVAFVCAEFGVHRSLPIYSGGLGVLAGDILKQASDEAFPLVGVGLMYHEGYFRQRIDAVGRQHEYWLPTDPERLPAVLVTGDDGLPLTIRVPVSQDEVVAQIWRVDVGRVPLYLLDAERPENTQVARWTSGRLYVGDPQVRLAQYALLGAGARAGARGARDRAGRSCTSTRVTARSRRSSWRKERDRRRRPGRPCARRRPPAGRLHDPHAGPGGQRHLPGRPRDRRARRLRARDRPGGRGAAAARPDRSRSISRRTSASPSSRCARAARRTA